MNTQNALFFMPLLVGGIFLITGIIMYKFPPKEINDLYGYRTKLSMKNKEQWDFAQIYSSKLMLLCGITLMAFSLIGLIIQVSEKTGVLISVIAIIGTLVFLIMKTERTIKKQFKSE